MIQAEDDTEPDRRKSYAGLLPPSTEFPTLVEKNEENLTVRYVVYTCKKKHESPSCFFPVVVFRFLKKERNCLQYVVANQLHKVQRVI